MHQLQGETPVWGKALRHWQSVAKVAPIRERLPGDAGSDGHTVGGLSLKGLPSTSRRAGLNLTNSHQASIALPRLLG